jgi:hypothetical protein
MSNKFLIAAVFLLIGSIVATLFYYHYDSGLFFNDINQLEAASLENIEKIRFRRVDEDGPRPYVVKIWVKNQFRVYRYEATGLDVAWEDTRSTIQRISFYQQVTSGILESVLTFGALYVASIGLATYHFISRKRNTI